jgi:NADP-dependent 3-hydroxy acid dehydrogenase YdfG
MSISVDLNGRCALVVGASSGLGREIGLAAARAGARVAFAARRIDRLEEAVRQAHGRALAVRCDVRSRADCQRTIAATVAEFGRLDALVFATGMSPLVMLEEAAEDDWRQVLETNTMGASLITAAALPQLRAHAGRAIYLSSYSVRQSLAGLGLYRVSKVALDALIECWRREHPDVAFTRVVVGNTVGTEFADGWDPQLVDAAFREWTRNSALPPTLMTADQVAEAVLTVIAARGYLDDIAIVPPPQRRAGG